jgi:hypothetical protein
MPRKRTRYDELELAALDMTDVEVHEGLRQLSRDDRFAAVVAWLARTEHAWRAQVGDTDAGPVVQQQVIAGQQQRSILGPHRAGAGAIPRQRRLQSGQARGQHQPGRDCAGGGRAGKRLAHAPLRLFAAAADFRGIAKGPQAVKIGSARLAFAPSRFRCLLGVALPRRCLQAGPHPGLYRFE